MHVFVITNNFVVKINVDVNVKNSLAKEDATKNLFGIIIVNVINHILLENVQVIKIVNVEKNLLINQLKSVVKILMEVN